ncbi:hypothetical protein RUM44_007186 [Polyplax serrata]|uniref:Uncharacterized protein n=1 Tax=Polyplax serrata TaxID=468196 RepID=A0ABR1B002_POLSC
MLEERTSHYNKSQKIDLKNANWTSRGRKQILLKKNLKGGKRTKLYKEYSKEAVRGFGKLKEDKSFQ